MAISLVSKILFPVIVKLVSGLLSIMVPELRELFGKLLKDWLEAAKLTPSPLDDFAAEALIKVLGFDPDNL